MSENACLTTDEYLSDLLLNTFCYGGEAGFIKPTAPAGGH